MVPNEGKTSDARIATEASSVDGANQDDIVANKFGETVVINAGTCDGELDGKEATASHASLIS